MKYPRRRPQQPPPPLQGTIVPIISSRAHLLPQLLFPPVADQCLLVASEVYYYPSTRS